MAARTLLAVRRRRAAAVAATAAVAAADVDRSKLGAGILYGNPNCDYVAEINLDDGYYRVIMDSGSSFLAVAGLGCSCGSASKYWADGSSGSFVANYGSGSLQGGLASSQASLGSNTTVLVQFGVVTKQTGFFTCSGEATSDGILGLAYDALAIDGVTPFMDSLAAAGTPNGFALQLCGRRLGLQKTGNYWIGGYDSSFTNTTMRYIQIVKKEYFNVQAYSLNINGEVISGTEALQSQTSIVDSVHAVLGRPGTTLLILQTQSMYRSVVQALNNTVFKWSPSATAEDVAVFFSGNFIPQSLVSIDPSHRLQVAFLGTENNPVDIAVPSINLVTYEDDMVAFTGIGYGSSINIFGETLLKGYVTFFDRGAGSRIGFAAGQNCLTHKPTVEGIDFFAAAPSLHATAGLVAVLVSALAALTVLV